MPLKNPSPYKSTSKIPSDLEANAWIEPSGRVWPVPHEGHQDFARWFFEDKDEGSYGDPIELLEEKGWVHLSGGSILYNKRMTSRQIAVVSDWWMSHPNIDHEVFQTEEAIYSPPINLKNFMESYAQRSPKISERLIAASTNLDRLGYYKLAEQLDDISLAPIRFSPPEKELVNYSIEYLKDMLSDWGDLNQESKEIAHKHRMAVDSLWEKWLQYRTQPGKPEWKTKIWGYLKSIYNQYLLNPDYYNVEAAIGELQDLI